MDRLLNALPITGLIVAFAMLWAGFGFFEALAIILIAVFAFMAVMVLTGPR